MARYSFVNLVEAQIKNTCFYLFLAFAYQGPQTLWTGQEILVEPKLHPTCSQAAVLQLVMNIWSGFATSQLVHTCISLVHENPFHPLARQCRGASDVRRKRGTVPFGRSMQWDGPGR